MRSVKNSSYLYHNYWKKGGRITLPFGNIFTLGGGSTPQKEHIWKFKNKQGIHNWKNAVFRLANSSLHHLYLEKSRVHRNINIRGKTHERTQQRIRRKKCGYLAKITETINEN